ncbi:sterile alpha motif domain-containing protein 13-like [Terrapene carolina triunguis]|uniref:sterile alpha motif domain-containing protein 13-like n=2 Tax=Emydidae TaxID=8476 RepID=UPI000E77CDE7|nr:sterile alpha motif domain-containing protein 13-like [Terrapene carolina triunguis]
MATKTTNVKMNRQDERPKEENRQGREMREKMDGEKRETATIVSGKVAELKETSTLSMLSVDMENKENGSLDVKNSVENGRPPDPADWAVTDVVNYFRTAGFEEQANAFQEQEIDGKSLLLMTRNDVLTGLALKLGPALKIYEYHVKPLQTQHLKNNSL